MAKVICALPNASGNINGVTFTPHPDGPGKDGILPMVSEDISDEQAAAFASIPGYTLVGVKKPPKTPAPTLAPVQPPAPAASAAPAPAASPAPAAAAPAATPPAAAAADAPAPGSSPDVF